MHCRLESKVRCQLTQGINGVNGSKDHHLTEENSQETKTFIRFNIY
jgi:hypothetical protein